MNVRAIIKYLLLIGLIEVNGVLVMLFLAGYKGGLFNRIELQQTTRGPYEIVSLTPNTVSVRFEEQFFQISLMLQTKNVQPLSACGIFYDVQSELKPRASSLGGFLVPARIRVEKPYAVNTVGRREVIVAKMKANPDLAPLKIYPKIREWMKRHHFQSAGPALEIYHPDGVIECEIPIQRAGL